MRFRGIQWIGNFDSIIIYISFVIYVEKLSTTLDKVIEGVKKEQCYIEKADIEA